MKSGRPDLDLDNAVPTTLEEWNTSGGDYLPGRLGFEFLKVGADEVRATFQVTKSHKAWNGFLHAGSIVTLADTCCGYGTVCSLPEGSAGFTTLDLSANFIGTAREGAVVCVAVPVHQGRTTQVWEATVADAAGKVIARFRCTQMILWPR